MNTRHMVIGLAALVVTIGSPVVADEIYTWTDAEGNVHYEDRPSTDQDVVLMEIAYNRTNRAAVRGRVQSHRDAQSSRQDARDTAAEEELTAAEQQAEAEQRQKQCESYRGKLQTLLQSSRVYRKDENGERVYLDDDQRQESRQRAEELVQEYCNS